jgi:hypothetical protein
MKSPLISNTDSLKTLTSSVDRLIAAFKGEPEKPQESAYPVVEVRLDGVTAPTTTPTAATMPTRVAGNIERARASQLAGVQGLVGTRARIASQVPDIDKTALNLAQGQTLALLEGYAQGLSQLNNQLATASEEQKPAIQANITTYKEAISGVTESIIDNATRLKEAGKSFSEAIFSGFSSGLKDLLSGKADENKSVWTTFRDNLLNNFTNTIIGSFVDGMMAPIKQALGDSVKNLGSGVFGTGQKTGTSLIPTGKAEGGEEGPFSGILASFKSGFETLKTSFEGIDFGKIFGDIGASLTSAASSLMGSIGKIDFGSIFGAVKGFFGFADGGYVSGAGTSRSDSIPAMLSNGEYVINAAATKQFRPLLASINSGSFGAFANGGLVSTGMLTTPSMTAIQPVANANGSGNQQIINLTITGDISRQTKGEIYKMLPSIAEGVNSHNREKGYR